MTQPPPIPTTAAPIAQRFRPLTGIYVWGVLTLLATVGPLGMGVLSVYDLRSPSGRPADRTLAWASLAAGGLALAAGAVALGWRRLPWAAVLGLQVLAAAAQALAVRAALASADDATRRGGDWEGIGVLMFQVFAAWEVGLGLLCVITAVYLCRRRVRDAFAAGGRG